MPLTENHKNPPNPHTGILEDGLGIGFRIKRNISWELSTGLTPTSGQLCCENHLLKIFVVDKILRFSRN